jgi:hypothetical protein
MPLERRDSVCLLSWAVEQGHMTNNSGICLGNEPGALGKLGTHRANRGSRGMPGKQRISGIARPRNTLALRTFPAVAITQIRTILGCILSHLGPLICIKIRALELEIFLGYASRFLMDLFTPTIGCRCLTFSRSYGNMSHSTSGYTRESIEFAIALTLLCAPARSTCTAHVHRQSNITHRMS